MREDKPCGKVAAYDPALYEHQIPGGMISNLRYQLETMKLAGRLPEILEEVAQVRRDLGYPIVVSPFAQYVVTQATLNVVQGERYKTIPDEIRKYASGYYGKLAAKPSGALRAGKRLMKHAFIDQLKAAAKIENREFSERVRSAEAKEALAASLEKRPPNFTKTMTSPAAA